MQLQKTQAGLRLAVLFDRLGPYHDARLRAAGKLGEVVTVEFSGIDDVYAWRDVRDHSSYRRKKLFHDGQIDSFSTSQIRQRLHRVMSRIRPDVVAIPGWGTRGALTALSWCCQTGTPAIAMSDSWSQRRRRSWCNEAIKQRIVSLFSAGFVAGEPHRRYLESLGMSAERIFTGYDVVDNVHFARGAQLAKNNDDVLRRQLDLPRRYFLSVCRFIPEKNLPRLLRAYAEYRSQADRQPWDLVITGDGPLRAVLLRQRKELGLEQTVHFPGFKDYGELPAYYALAEAFILPSVSETWGLVVNEAMAAGLPVIVSSHCGCVTDLVREGCNGFTIDPLDVRSIRDRLVHVASRATDRSALARGSRRIIAEWTTDTFAVGLWQATGLAAEQPRVEASPWGEILLAIASRRPRLFGNKPRIPFFPVR